MPYVYQMVTCTNLNHISGEIFPEQERRLPDLSEPCLMVLMMIIKMRYKGQGRGS